MCYEHLVCYDLVLAVVALLFSAVAAWSDIKPMLPYILGRQEYLATSSGKIPNKLLIAWLAVSTLLLLLSPLVERLGLPFVAWHLIQYNEGISYPAAVAINTGIAFVLAFILWNFNLWVAGDAKMFIVLSYSIPLSAYHSHYTPYFPSFDLFFNTFVASLVLLVLELVVEGVRRGVQIVRCGPSKFVSRWLKLAWENRKVLINLALFFLAIFTTIRILRHFAREWIAAIGHLDKTIVYLILFMMFHPLMHFAQSRYAFFGSLTIVVGYIVFSLLSGQPEKYLYELVNIGALTLSIMIFRGVYDLYLAATDEIQIPYTKLKPGMVLSRETVRQFKERKEFYRSKLEPLLPDGLTPEQVEAIKEWFEKNKPDGTVGISRTIPFAPALLVGAILTLIFGGVVVQI